MNILVGMLTGATASMGLGGGFILLVYLSVFTEIPQDIAQGINLLFFLPIALLSLVIHIKNKLTDLKLVGKYLILGLPCAIVGSYVAGITDVAVLRKLFGIFVLYIGINQLYTSALQINRAKKDPTASNAVGFFYFFPFILSQYAFDCCSNLLSPNV